MSPSPRVAITGAGGQLGRQLVDVFAGAGWEVLGAGHDRLDIASPAALEALVRWRPRVVVNAAAWTDVDGCAREPDRALLVNGEAAGHVAAAAALAGATAVQISTNEVFDGEAATPYDETAEANPINAYGASKLAGERAVAAATADYLVVRTAWLFGPGGANFPTKILAAAQRQIGAGLPLRVVADEVGNPTWAHGLAAEILRAVELRLSGLLESDVLHLAGQPPVSRFGWAQVVVEGLQGIELEAIAAQDFVRPSRAPARAVLSTERARTLGIAPSDWRTATRLYTAQLLAAGAPT